MDADGSNVQALTNDPCPASGPVWSPNGQQIAFAEGAFNTCAVGIEVMNADGSNRHVVVPAAYGAQPYRTVYEPAWSSAGTKLSFVEFQMVDYPNFVVSIWVVNTDGSNPIKVYESDSAQDIDIYPTWSPDGTRIVFNHHPPDSLFNHIFVMNADGSDVHCLTCNDVSNSDHQLARWSPDGQHISYVKRVYDADDADYIAIINVDGSNERLLAQTPHQCVAGAGCYLFGPPSWSPNGSQLVFAVGASTSGNGVDTSQLYRIDADGSNLINISNNGYYDIEPDWGIAEVCEPSGSALRSGAVSPMSACQAPTPTPTATLTVDQQIEQYNVSLSGDWSADDRLELLKGLQATGQALSLQFGGGEYPDAFRRVMFQAGATSILFNRTTTNSYTCQTFNLPGGGLQARIDCDPNVSFTQYVAVHELGHVFEGRMGGTQLGATYYGLLKQPPPTGVVVDYGNEGTPPGIVFGNRLDPVNLTPDWVRGNRGWGSAALPITSTYFCDFQQDPYSVQDWLVTATPGQPNQIREVDEAAADMFLNWVYSKIGSGGFQNTSWIGITSCVTGTPQPTERPGDTRDNFMNNVVMPTIATYVPTPTPTPTP